MNRPAVTLSSLPSAQRRLVDLLRAVGYGRIEGLRVDGGLPAFDPPPRVVRRLKVGHRNPTRAAAPSGADYELRAAVVDALTHLAAVGDGVVELIEVADGLPLHLEVPARVDV